MKYRYIIVEDNKQAYESLQLALEKHNQYEEITFATNVKDALKLVYEHKPDLIFLDVELGDEKGFELIDALKDSMFQLPFIIMTTAHDYYGKEAVNNNVLYFVSKPIDELELQKGLYQFEKEFANSTNQLVLKVNEGIELIPYQDILYIKSNGNNAEIIKCSGETKTVAKSLKSLEKRLPNSFLRVFKRHIANLNYIVHLNTTEEKATLVYKDGETVKIKIGRSYIDLLKRHLKV